MKSVYCAVRSDSLYKRDYISSLKVNSPSMLKSAANSGQKIKRKNNNVLRCWSVSTVRYRLAPDLSKSYLQEELPQVEFCPSRIWVHMRSNINVHAMEVNLKPNSNTLKPDGSHHDRSAAYVSAQQYYSATFFPQQFHSRKKKKFGARLKYVAV